MNFRELLLSQGLSPKDIDEAVREARRATRMLHFASGASVQVFTRAASRIEHPKLKQAMTTTANAVRTFHVGLGEMLCKR
jgi:hypothetical protein